MKTTLAKRTERIPINVDKDGCSYCLVSKYYKEKAKIAKYLMGGGGIIIRE